MKNNVEITEMLKSEVKKYQCEQRYLHTLSVYGECKKLADIFSLSEEEKERLLRAALLHDITKDMDGKAQIELCNKYGIEPPKSEKDPMPTVHQDTGAFFAREKFGEDIVDDTVFYAIASHTTGREGMNNIDKMLFLADYIEPRRKYRSCIETREYLYSECAKINKNDKAALFRLLTKTVTNVIASTVEYLISKRRMIDHRMIIVWNSLI